MPQRKLRVALLSEFPAALAEGLQVGQAATERAKVAHMTVEGSFIKGLMAHPDVQLSVLTFSKATPAPVIRHLGTDTEVHFLPARPGTGMVLGWVPRALIARRHLRRIQPDVVHGLRMLGGYALMAALSGFPNVITLEEFLSTMPPPPGYRALYWAGRQAECWTIHHARHVTLVSDHVRRLIEKNTRGALYRLPNVVGDDFFAISKGLSEPEVVFVGRVAPEKGLLDMLKAAAILEREGIRARWRIVGGPTGSAGPAYLAECRRFAVDRLPNQQVEFLGWLANEDVAGLYKTATCSVVPSRAPYETFCISMAEAMAAGTPPVAYDFGPLAEHIEDGVSGYLVSVGDVELMAKRLRALLTDPGRSVEMGKEARLRAMGYKQEIVIGRLVQVYRQVLAEERGWT